MKLSEYLSSAGLTHQEFAHRIGVSQATVTRYTRDLRFPRPEVVQRIHEATNGRVSAADFYSLPQQEPAE